MDMNNVSPAARCCRTQIFYPLECLFNSFVAKQNELLWTVGKRRQQKSAYTEMAALAQIAEVT